MPYYTYEDAIQQLVDYLGGNDADKAQRSIKLAIANAGRELMAAHEWACSWDVGHINIVAAVTGTCTYTHATRTFTISSGSWPTWAADGTLRMSPSGGRGDYPIVQRTSSTTLIGDPDVNPGSDLTATSFTIYQDRWTLPADFRRLGDIIPGQTIAKFRPFLDNAKQRRLIGGGGIYSFAIVADRKRPHRMALQLESWPTRADTVSYAYQREARQLRYTGLATRDRTGTITVDGTTVTGSGTQFDAGMVGCILRGSGHASEYPTDLYGSRPALVEDVIVAYSSATGLTLLENSVDLETASKYTISDPIDFSTNLFNVFQRCCEKQGEIMRQREGAGKNDAIQLYELALADARIADQRDAESFFLGGGDKHMLRREREMMTQATSD